MAPLTGAPLAVAKSATAVTPKPPAVAPHHASIPKAQAAPLPASAPPPLVAGTSAPPPMIVTMPTEAPPPMIVTMQTEAPPPMSVIPIAIASSSPPPLPVLTPAEMERAAARVAEARRTDEIRNEARALVHEALEEALAPLHHAMLALERRLESLENRPIPQPAPFAQVAPPAQNAPVSADGSGQVRVPAAPASVPRAPVSQAAMRAMAPSNPFAPRISSSALPSNVALFDGDIPFDGQKRKRRVATMFILFLVLVAAGLVGPLIYSYSH